MHALAPHLTLPRRAAAMIHPRVRRHVAMDELVALGNVGLAEAARRYDPARGVAFPTYAWYRVLGAVLDGLRQAAPLPRRTWARLIALQRASDALDAARGCEDRRAQLAHAMSAIRTMYATSLEALRERGFDAAADGPAPPDGLDEARLRARLVAAIAELPAPMRALIERCYFDGLRLCEAAEQLGCSKSWASRLHAQAIERLRAAIEA